MDEGLAWIRQDPARWLSLVPKKLSHTFDHESFPIGYLSQADPAGWPEETRFRGRAILSTTHCALLSLAALGMVARPSRRRGVVPLFVQLVAFLLVVGFALHGLQSDLHPFWPVAIVLVLLGAIPVAGAPPRAGVVGYLVFAVASVAVTHAIFFGEDRYHLVITPALCVLAASALRRPDERAAQA